VNQVLQALHDGNLTEKLAATRLLSERSLYFFAKVVLGKDYLRPEPHTRVCKFLQSPTPQQRLLVLPRSFLKSTLTSLALPLWMALQDPSLTILIRSNSDENARKMLVELRSHLEQNELLRTLWSDVVPDGARDAERWSDSQVCLKRHMTNKEMTFEAAGIATTVVGRHYRRFIIDDPIMAKRDDRTGEEAAPTKEDIDAALAGIKKHRPMWTDPLETLTFHCGTRWAHYDVIAYLKGLKRDDGSTLLKVLELAALDEDGQPVYDRYPLEVLADIRAEVGPYLWASQYMNKPIAEVDRLFRREQLRYWSYKPENDSIAQAPNVKDLWVTMTLDPACREKKHNDYTAMVIVGTDLGGNWYLLDYLRKRLPPEQTVREAVRLYSKWNARVLGIETVSAQLTFKSWIDEIARSRDTYMRTVELRSKNIAEAKERRIEGLQPLVARGQLFLEKGRSAALEQEMEEYPNGRHDDLLDALAYHKQLVRKPKVAPPEPEDEDWKVVDPSKPPEMTYEGLMRKLKRSAGRTGRRWRKRVPDAAKELVEI